jgi:hypothetical protein
LKFNSLAVRDIGIVLAVGFILWTFGLALAVYEAVGGGSEVLGKKVYLLVY